MATIRLGDIAPNFQSETTEEEPDFYEFLGNGRGILFSHPADFTPVCTTRLGTSAKLKDEFSRRLVKIIALRVDSLESHQAWIKDINETQNTHVNFPVIADPDRKIAELFDFIHPDASSTDTARSVLIIAPDKTIKLIIVYTASTGSYFNEILRVTDSLQLTPTYQVATPANWQQGEDVVITPAVKDEEIPAKFPKGHTRLKPCLRLTPQPNIQ